MARLTILDLVCTLQPHLGDINISAFFLLPQPFGGAIVQDRDPPIFAQRLRVNVCYPGRVGCRRQRNHLSPARGNKF